MIMEVEVRSDSVHIEGYVNAVARDSRVMSSSTGKFVEQVEPGAFAEALVRAKDVALLLNHRKDKVYASTADGTLQLREDAIGLRASADVTDPEIIDKARNGKIRGWSFGMYVREQEMEQRADNVPRRHIRSLDIFEVTMVDESAIPCYAGTLFETRSEGEEVFSETRSFVSDDVKIVDNSAVSDGDTAPDAPDLREWEYRLLELRYNPYHDARGRFASGGGGGGGTLYVPNRKTGEKGMNGDGSAFYIGQAEGKDDAEVKNAEAIASEIISKGLSSNMAGIRRKAENGEGVYEIKNAKAINAKTAENFDPNLMSEYERNGNTVIAGYLKDGSFAYYANKSDSPEIAKISAMRRRGSATVSDNIYDDTVGAKTTTTYDRWYSNQRRKFDNYYYGTRSFEERFEELRFNPNHDAGGRFCSGGGSG